MPQQVESSSSSSISDDDNAMSVDGDVSYCGAEMDEA
jgi:hypothetical protein